MAVAVDFTVLKISFRVSKIWPRLAFRYKMKAPQLVSLLLVSLAPEVARAVDPLVNLGYTQLQGVSQVLGVTQWLGVRFAAAPVGNLRFAAPVDPPATTGVQDATKVYMCIYHTARRSAASMLDQMLR